MKKNYEPLLSLCQITQQPGESKSPNIYPQQVSIYSNSSSKECGCDFEVGCFVIDAHDWGKLTVKTWQ